MTPRGRILLAVAFSLPAAAPVWFGLRHALPPLHIDPLWRGIGVFSMGISLVTLAYGVGAFGHALAGWIGVAVMLGPLALAEVYLFLVLRKPA